MIVPVTMYACKCDNCGVQWEDSSTGMTAFTDAASIDGAALDSFWVTDDDKHYCPKCFDYDDDNNLVIKTNK